MNRSDRGSAVAEFVLVLAIFVPLVLGILQVGLVIWVRNELTVAAADAARAAAPLGADVTDARARAEHVLARSVASRYLDGVEVSESRIDGVDVVEVRLTAGVPPLGLFGPRVPVSVTGHAIRQGLR